MAIADTGCNAMGVSPDRSYFGELEWNASINTTSANGTSKGAWVGPMQFYAKVRSSDGNGG
jgi:hypothetical protein